jgi:hypothetical protein
MILAWAGFFPVMYAAAVLSERHFKGPVRFSIAIIAWFLFSLSTSAEVTYFRCPRGRKAFAATWWYRLGVFARRCVHRGLPKYTDG